MRVRHFSTRPLAAFSVALLAGTALLGCDGDTTATMALHEAQATLEALHDGPIGSPGEFVISTHREIRQTLAPALSASTESIQAAAQLVEGQTFAGDAEVAADTAAELESAAADILNEAQTLSARLYVWRHARADAAGSYSPAQSVQEVDAAIATAQADRVDLIKERDDAQSRLDDLVEAVSAGAQETTSLRTQEVQLRDQSLDLEGDERLITIEQVYNAQRAADAAVARTSEFEARVTNLRPALEGLDRRIAGADRLIELLRATRESLLERGARGARTAQVDREQATIVASRLEGLLNELHDFRTGELETAYDAASTAYRKAGTSLRSAGSGGSSPVWLAGVQFGQAQLAGVRAASDTRYADFLNALAIVEPRLPFAGELASRAIDARETAAGHVSDASTAFSSAASGYRRAGRGPSAERMRQLADQLDARASGDDPDLDLDLDLDLDPDADPDAAGEG